jgi:hypothetical protein
MNTSDETKKSEKPKYNVTRIRNEKPILTEKDLTLRELYLLNYHKAILLKEPEIAEKLYQINEHRKPISNRGLEHLNTKFSIKYDIRIDENGNADSPYGQFYITDEYNKNLPKTDIDPCRRGPLIEYIHNGRVMKTTIAQLGSNIANCRSPIIKYAEKEFHNIQFDHDEERGINAKKKKKSKFEIKLPTRPIRSFHHTIPIETVIRF